MVAFRMRGFQDVPSVKSFTIVMWLEAAWAFLYVLDASTQFIPLKTFIVNFTYIPTLLATSGWLVIALEYTGREKWLTRRRAILLLILPAIFVAAAFTSHLHTLWRYNYQLIWPDVVPTQIAARGPLYWVYIAYLIGLVGVSVALLLSSYKDRSRNFQNTALLSLGLLIPTITGVLFVFNLLPVRGFDWTSTSFVFQLTLYIWAILRGHLFDIVPIARDIVMENMEALAFVTNQRGYIVDVNRAAQNALGLSPPKTGLAPNQLPQSWAGLFQKYTHAPYKSEIRLNLQNSQRDFALTISALQDKYNQPFGYLFLLYDITERKQVEVELQRQYERQGTLHTVTLDLLNRHNLEDVLSTILLHAADLLDSPFGMLDILEGDTLINRATTKMTESLKGLRYPLNETHLSRLAILSGQPQFTQNYSEMASRLKMHDPHKLTAVGNVPIMLDEQAIGVLALGRTDINRPFTDEDIHIISSLAQLAALAIDNARLFAVAEHELLERKNKEVELRQVNQKLQFQLEQIQLLQSELREQAIRDPLTGLYNRRYLKEILARELALAARESHSLSFVMMDLDHFKNINDTFGHTTGDRVLQSLATQLLSQARTGDIICRYGGEEILAVLPNVSVEIAFQVTERWRITFQTANQASPVLLENEETQATISCGISVFPIHGRTSEELISAADQAMYRAKELGRNQTVIWQAE